MAANMLESMRAVRGMLADAGAAERVTDEAIVANSAHILAIVMRFTAVQRGLVGLRSIQSAVSISEDVEALMQRLDGFRAEALALKVLTDEPSAFEERGVAAAG